MGSQSAMHTSGLLDTVLFAVSYHWKWGLCVLLIPFITVHVLRAVIGIDTSSESLERLKIERVQLTDERLEAWSRTAGILAEQRDNGKIRIPARTLPELIEWGRTNPEAIKKACPNSEPEIFLNVALSIELARKNLRNVVEYKMRLQEAERKSYAMADVAFIIPFSYPSPPRLKGWEQSDLKAYERNELMVEGTLYDLIPELPFLVPAWEESNEEQEDQMNETAAVLPK